MQRDRFVAAATWLDAEVDLEVAREIANRYPSRACFHAQQAAGLALKAALIALTDDHPRPHVGDMLVREITGLGYEVPADIAAAANRLDLFHMGSRYPDALGGADPSKVTQKVDADFAIQQGRSVFAFARSLIERLAREAASP